MALHNPAQLMLFCFFLFVFIQSPSTFYHGIFAPFTQDYSMVLTYTLLFHLCPSAHAVIPFFCNVLFLPLFLTSSPYLKSPLHWKNSLSWAQLKCHFLHGASLTPQAKSSSFNETKQRVRKGRLYPSLIHLVMQHIPDEGHSWTQT